MSKILLVCHSNSTVGLGHLSRILVLAQAIKSHGAVIPELVIFGDFFPKEGISEFHTHVFPLSAYFTASIENIISSDNFSAVVFDLHAKQDISDFDNLLLRLKNRQISIIGIDSLLEYCDILDLIWIPSFNFDASSHSNCKCIIKSGWDSFLIQKRLSHKEWTPGSSVLVLTGGSDTAKLSRTLPAYLDKSLRGDIKLNWVRGPFSEVPILPTETRLDWIIHDSPSGLDELILNSDYVLTIFGVSLFEVLQYGVPTVVFSPYQNKDDQELQSLSLENVALVAANSLDAISGLNTLINDENRARDYSLNSLKKLAVNGTQNLVQQIYLLIGV